MGLGGRSGECFAAGPLAFPPRTRGETMVRTVLQTLAGLALASGIAQAASAHEWAKKMFEVTNHDFGTIARGAKAEFAFEFTNLYKEDVRIAGVRSNCGCTTPRFESGTLKSYEKGAVVARINSQSFLGHQGATITVTFDKPMRAQVQLHVKAYVYSNVLLEPAGVSFGTVTPGQPAQRTLDVRYTGRAEWRILDVRSHDPHLAGKLTETHRAGNQVRYDLTVTLDADAPPGYIREQIWLITNDPRAERVPVLVEGHVLPDLSVSPSTLFLGVVPAGQSVTRQIVVRGQHPFRIADIRADCDCLKGVAPADDEPKAIHLVAVTFMAGKKTGKISETIVIDTDSGNSVELPAYAVVESGAQ